MEYWLLLLCCVTLAQRLYVPGLCKRAVDLVPATEDGQEDSGLWVWGTHKCRLYPNLSSWRHNPGC